MGGRGRFGAHGLSVEAEGSAVAGRVERSEPLVALETHDGVFACPVGLLDSVELGLEEEKEVFVLEDDIAEVAPRLLVVVGLAEVEQHLRLADEREQGEFLRDTGNGDVVGLGELPADDADGGRPVAGEAAVVVLLVALREVAADRGVRVALPWLALGDRGEALVQVGNGRVPSASRWVSGSTSAYATA